MKALRSCQAYLVTFTVLFAMAANAAGPDNVFRTRLIGTWHEKRVIDCETNDFRIDLKQDGSFEVKGLVEGCGRKFTLTWRGKWEVKAGRFHYTTTFSDPPDEYPVGESFSDQIVSVTSTEWVMLEESTGRKSIAKRVERL
jgi:hypothetical protein